MVLTKENIGGEDVLTGCLCCLGANQYMSSRGTMGIEILPKERNKSCLFLRSPSPPKSSHRSPLGLELCLCCKGGKKGMAHPSEFNRMSGLRKKRNEGKNNQLQSVSKIIFLFYWSIVLLPSLCHRRQNWQPCFIMAMGENAARNALI